MAKHKKREEWIILFQKYETDERDWKKYMNQHMQRYKIVSTAKKSNRLESQRINQVKTRFIYKYNSWKIDDNLFMNKKRQKKEKGWFRHSSNHWRT